MKDLILARIANFESYSDATKEFIGTLIEELYNSGQLESCDIGALNMLARNYNIFITTDTTKLTTDQKVFNLYKYSLNSCFQIVRDFGLTPKSRKLLFKRENSDKQTNSLLNEFE